MEERYLLAGLKQGNKEAFSLLFTAYYKNLVLFGGNFLPDKMACEDIVQSVFLNLWNDRATLVIDFYRFNRNAEFVGYFSISLLPEAA